MAIFVIPGAEGQIKTTLLPSGDLAVSCPRSGLLEQAVFDCCKFVGRRNPGYGGWIVPSTKKGITLQGLESRCEKIAE